MVKTLHNQPFLKHIQRNLKEKPKQNKLPQEHERLQGYYLSILINLTGYPSDIIYL